MGGSIRKHKGSKPSKASKPRAKPANEKADRPKKPTAPAKAKPKTKPAAAKKAKAADPPAKAKKPVAPRSTASADALAHQAETQRREEQAPPPPPAPSRPLTEAEQATVTEASTAIHVATVQPHDNGPPTVHPEAGSAEINEQLEAHPELADEILAASEESLDAITEELGETENQETVNATVDNLARATERAGEYGQDRLGETLAPASGNSPKVKAALAASQVPGAARLTETTSHNLPEGARANFRSDVTRARTAAAAVATAYQPGATQTSPASAAAALQAQVEAHPELASVITLAAQPTLDSIGAYLAANPSETASVEAITRSFSAVADQTGTDGDDLLVETLAGVPPDNEGLLAGLAQASLENQVDLGRDLAEHHGEPASALIERATQVGDQVQEVDALLESGDLAGAYQASQLLREYATGVPAGMATALLQGLNDTGSIARITSILQENAGQVDRDGYEWGFIEGTPQEAFDGILLDLSYAATRSGDLELTQDLGRQLAAGMNADDIERYDEAFHNAVATGQGADLTAAVIEELQAAGRTEQAEHVLDELDAGLHHFRNYWVEQADKRDQIYQELAYLNQQFGPLGTEEEQAAASQAFLDQFSELDEVERMGGVMATDLDVIARLRESVPDLDVDDLDDNEDELLREFPRFATTVEGSERVGEALDAQARGHSSFLDRLTSVDLEGEDREEFLEKAGMALNRAAIQQSSAAVAMRDGDRSGRILDGLLSIEGAAELQGVSDIADLEEIISAMAGMSDVSAQYDPLPDVLAGAYAGFEEAIAGAGGRGLDLSSSPRLQALTGGAAFLALAGVVAGGKPENWEDLVNDVVTTTGAGLEAGAAIAGFRSASGTLIANLGVGASVAGLVGAGFSALGAARSAEDGDWAAAGLQAGSAVGGALVALGTTATATGIGAVLVVGAAAGLYQLGRVRASNVHENENTEAYLRELLPNADSGVINHLRDADDEGVNAGIVLQAAADRLDMDLPEFFDQFSELSSDQVAELIEAAHYLVGNDQREVSDLPSTHPSDEDVGTYVQDLEGEGFFRLNSEGAVVGDGTLSAAEEERLTGHTRRLADVEASPLGDDRFGFPSNAAVVGPQSVQGWINYYEYLTGESLG